MTSTDEQPTSGGEEPWTGADTTGGEPRAAKIVFISDRDGEQRLYWMNPDGSEQAPISAGTGIERDPTWTANGAELLFTRGQDVWRLDLDSGVEVNLTDHPANDALEALSPDDAWFLFTSNRVDQTRDLFVMSAASGGEAIQVADAIEDESLWVSYSPDGGRIVFTTSTFGPDRLVVMNADGTGATDFAGPLGLTELGPPAWSPDGTRIAVSGQTDQPTPVLHVLNPDGTGLTPLTAGYAGEPVWSPDGQRIAYRGHDGEWRIGVVGSDGSGEQILTPDLINCYYPDWSPDGSLLAFEAGEGIGASSIYTVGLDGSPPVRLTEGSEDRSARWRP